MEAVGQAAHDSEPEVHGTPAAASLVGRDESADQVVSDALVRGEGGLVKVICAYLFGDAERTCRIVRGPARTDEWAREIEPWVSRWFFAESVS